MKEYILITVLSSGYKKTDTLHLLEYEVYDLMDYLEERAMTHKEASELRNNERALVVSIIPNAINYKETFIRANI